MMINEKTLRLWQTFETEPALSGFVLVGGTALALQIGHRDSEDIDLAFTHSLLPKKRVALFAGKQGLVPADRVEDIEDFIDAGLDLFDHQRNFLSPKGVKVSFFAPEAALSPILSAYCGHQRPMVASVHDIFKMKALVSASRSKSRDWYDLYVLMNEHGYTMRDFESAFIQSGHAMAMDIALSRLKSGKVDPRDEGFLVTKGEAPSIKKMADFFKSMADDYFCGKATQPNRFH